MPCATQKMLINFLLFFSTFFNDPVNCFVPGKIIDYVISESSTNAGQDIGRISETITHEQILERGLGKSITKFFYDQTDGPNRINLTKITNHYQDIRNIYADYYGKTVCTPKVSDIITVLLGPNVALVDLDPLTKDLPYAHFDAEKFNESNTRVMNFTNFIYFYLDLKDYEKALELSGQIMHTIHDFYSHSNWVEMGNVDRINRAIGTQDLYSMPIADEKDAETCLSNCELIETPCSTFTQSVIDFLKLLELTSALFECPIRYYKCKSNLAEFDKLVSGYYTGQKLSDGTPVPKPSNLLKCSHGGLIDVDSILLEPTGGINKDSGYYLFSPRADLHLVAAHLAINHTEYFFDQIRQKIGDQEFDKFLDLTYSSIELSRIPDNVTFLKMPNLR
ncbi:von Willebrand factor A domain-containing 7 [Brachionus plicatilis]|uniref:von Willebrand factor A domain-containing 7 n=1 Tax=Brachionus plicatilis TaxID=10195 RepID=A0A3M7SZB1_BRAPC|nr:von Willebrand factor A domain-containing 7 [Brachionus plicatilis]